MANRQNDPISFYIAAVATFTMVQRSPGMAAVYLKIYEEAVNVALKNRRPDTTLAVKELETFERLSEKMIRALLNLVVV